MRIDRSWCVWVSFLKGRSWERRGSGQLSELLSHRQSNLRQGQETKVWPFGCVVLPSVLLWSDAVCSYFQEEFTCGELIEAPPSERKLELLQSWNLLFPSGCLGTSFSPPDSDIWHVSRRQMNWWVCKYVPKDVLFPHMHVSYLFLQNQ